MAHAFLERGLQSQGMEVLKTNLLLYPDIWQVNNSYAAALLKVGKKQTAFELYQRALKLNSKNEEATRALSIVNGKH